MSKLLFFARSLRVVIGVACLSSITSSLQAGFDINVDLQIGIGKEIEPTPVVVRDNGGPPPWAPAHGRRAKAVYHYYPEQGVYRNAESGVWFVYRDGKWSAEARLPTTIRIGSDSAFVTLGMNTETPYHYHGDVSGFYPAPFAVRVNYESRATAAHSGKGGKKVPPGHAKKKW